MDIQCGLIVGGVSIILVALGYGYKIHADRRHIKLEKTDREQHQHNEQRIATIEKKNGDEQHQIDAQAKEISELKDKLANKDNKYKGLKGDIRLIKALMTLDTEARVKAMREAEKEQEDDDDEWDDEPEPDEDENK